MIIVSIYSYIYITLGQEPVQGLMLHWKLQTLQMTLTWKAASGHSSQHTKGSETQLQHFNHSLKLVTNRPHLLFTHNYISLSITDLCVHPLILFWYFFKGMSGETETVWNSHSVLSYMLRIKPLGAFGLGIIELENHCRWFALVIWWQEREIPETQI